MTFWDKIAAEDHLLTFPDNPHGPVGLIYPNLYGVGMSSLGFQQVYRLFRESGCSVERIVLDRKSRETRSVENRTPLFRFPLLAASLTYELDVVNLLRMLLNGGVPILSDERGDQAPILLVGGQAASANPRLLQRIADAVALGEGEGIVEPVARVLSQHEGRPRTELLEALAELDSIYVPKIHGEFDSNRFDRSTLDPIDSHPCHTVIRARDDEFGGAFLLEVSRGCNFRCKFCIVPAANGIARFRDDHSLIDILERYQKKYAKVGLLGAAVADHPQVEAITEWLVSRGKQVSTSSLRAEKVSEAFLDLLRRGGQQTITIAPESGGIETRSRMRKNVNDESYLRLAEIAGKKRFPYMKLYFLLGVPGADLMEEATQIIEFSRKMGAAFNGSGGSKVIVAVSPFVPKPATEWAREPIWNPKALKKASRVIRKQLAFRGDFKVPPVNVKEARAEAVLSWLGPEITGDLIALAKSDSPAESAFSDFDLNDICRI